MMGKLRGAGPPPHDEAAAYAGTGALTLCRQELSAVFAPPFCNRDVPRLRCMELNLLVSH